MEAVSSLTTVTTVMEPATMTPMATEFVTNLRLQDVLTHRTQRTTHRLRTMTEAVWWQDVCCRLRATLIRPLTTWMFHSVTSAAALDVQTLLLVHTIRKRR